MSGKLITKQSLDPKKLLASPLGHGRLSLLDRYKIAVYGATSTAPANHRGAKHSEGLAARLQADEEAQQ